MEIERIPEQKYTDAKGRKQFFEAAVALMDDDLREEVHKDMAPCTAQKFIEEYARRHEERFNEPFFPYTGETW